MKPLRVDPDKVWLELCRGDKLAQDRCKTFLDSYVENSKRYFLVLGPKERELRRTVTSAATVREVWRALIAEADRTVLRDKRQQDRDNSTMWELQFVDNTKRYGKGPVFEVSKVRLP